MNISHTHNKLALGFSEQGNPICWNPLTNNNLLLAGTHAWGMIQPMINQTHPNEFQFVIANIAHEDEVEPVLSHVKTFQELEWLTAWIFNEYDLRCNEPLVIVKGYPKLICVIRGLDDVEEGFIETLRFLIANGHYVGIHFIVIYDDPSAVSPLIERDFQIRAIAGSLDVDRKFFGFPTCQLTHYVDSFEFTGVLLNSPPKKLGHANIFDL